MLIKGLEIVQDAYTKYTAAGVGQLLLIGAITMLLIREKKKENKVLLYYIITLFLIVGCPPMAYILSRFIGESVYWRVFWLVPSVIIIALAGTKIIEQTGKKSKQKILIAAMLLVIVVGGKSAYRSENFAKSENLHKLPQEAIDICEMVAPEGAATKMIVPETIVSYIRQYNPNIKLLYGRNMGKDYQKGKRYKILLQLNSENPDYEYIATFTAKKKCEYVIFENTSNNLENMEGYGYQLFAVTENYTIFQLVQSAE